ncbi:MAG: single-stranded DNA-binding protein [Deltaproteobacteria bacterium]|nr:single-stranded DNA-binding protein [Deltaproteobacteria bacterium]
MAEGVNKAILVGNLGKDPDLSYTQNGVARCRFSLATSESYTNNSGDRQERTEWHNIVVWGKLAETVAKFLQKGRQCYLEGRIQNRSYDDKEGIKRYISEINANRVTFLGGRGGDGGYQGGGGGGYQGGGGGGQGGGGGGQGGGQGGGGQGGGGEPPAFGPNDDDIPF